MHMISDKIQVLEQLLQQAPDSTNPGELHRQIFGQRNSLFAVFDEVSLSWENSDEGGDAIAWRELKERTNAALTLLDEKINERIPKAVSSAARERKTVPEILKHRIAHVRELEAGFDAFYQFTLQRELSDAACIKTMASFIGFFTEFRSSDEIRALPGFMELDTLSQQLIINKWETYQSAMNDLVQGDREDWIALAKRLMQA